MSNIPLGQLSVEEFLSNYWQKKPVLIRQAFPNFQSPLEPDELAGLTLQDDVLSRLILEKGGDYPWQLKHGPFQDADFEALGDHHWTILVQEVDRHVPAVADLFDQFQFLPGWRKDDVMVSFATHDAGVGAHIDSYDVFLLQGSGRRRWEIGPALSPSGPVDGGLRARGSAAGGPAEGRLSTSECNYIEGLDVRILADFEPTEVYELEPGDMLYLPPGVPHNGVALEPCLTYSFGFLAPTRAEMVGEFADWYQQRFGPSRYADADLLSEQSSGLITHDDLNRVLRLLQQVPLERDALAEWFGTFITRPQRGPANTEEFEGSYQDFRDDFQECHVWRRHEGIRIAGWAGETLRLFVDGEQVEHNLSKEQLDLLTGTRELLYENTAGQSNLLELLYRFTQRGWGYLLSEDNDG
jgi:50S ribosomal protein L16 3-hydroxylase